MREVSIVGMPVSAEVAELADAQASGACGGNPVGVQIPPSAPCTTRFAWVHGGARGWASWKAIRVVHALNPSEAMNRIAVQGRSAWFRASLQKCMIPNKHFTAFGTSTYCRANEMVAFTLAAPMLSTAASPNMLPAKRSQPRHDFHFALCTLKAI